VGGGNMTRVGAGGCPTLTCHPVSGGTSEKGAVSLKYAGNSHQVCPFVSTSLFMCACLHDICMCACMRESMCVVNKSVLSCQYFS